MWLCEPGTREAVMFSKFIDEFLEECAVCLSLGGRLAPCGSCTLLTPLVRRNYRPEAEGRPRVINLEKFDDDPEKVGIDVRTLVEPIQSLAVFISELSSNPDDNSRIVP